MRLATEHRTPANDRSRKTPDLTKAQFQQLAEFRHQLRRFLHFSQEAAESVGLRPQQYQLLLAVYGMDSGQEPNIANVAARLLLRHNSAVELVDRTISLGLLRRTADLADHRRILLRVTPEGERILRSLAVHHLQELEEAGPQLIAALRRVTNAKPASDGEQEAVGSTAARGQR